MYMASSSGSTPQFVECAAQVVLDDLLGGTNDLSYFAVGQPFPDQHGDLHFFRGKA